MEEEVEKPTCKESSSPVDMKQIGTSNSQNEEAPQQIVQETEAPVEVAVSNEEKGKETSREKLSNQDKKNLHQSLSYIKDVPDLTKEEKRKLGYPTVKYINNAQLIAMRERVDKQCQVPTDEIDKIHTEISVSLRSNVFPGLGMSDQWQSVNKATYPDYRTSDCF